MSEQRMKLAMFDDNWIDFRRGTVRRWFSPEYHGLGQVGPYSSLVYDPERGKYRMYYEVLINWGDDGPRQLKLVESDDLIHFTPVYADDGSDVIYDAGTGLHGVSVMYDAHEKDPARRYKLAGMLDVKPIWRGEVEKGVEFAFSADGIHWEKQEGMMVGTQISDTLNKLVYNPIDDEYMLLHRSAFVDRRISVRTSKDFVNWTEPRIMLQPGPEYNDGYTGMQHYAMAARYMDSLFYGLVWRFNTSLYDLEFSRIWGYMEPELVYSYDGKEFLHTTGKPVLERPFAPNPGCCGLSAHDICESADGKHYFLSFYGATFTHGTEETNGKYKAMMEKMNVQMGNPIYRIRKDGFCGIESVNPGGIVVTKPIELDEADLSFNLRANCGAVRFGIMKQNGEYIEGFSLDDSVPFEFDDSVDVHPKWKEHDLSEVTGRQIRVVVELNTAILHCITATARPHIVQRQRSFSHPEAMPKE